MVILVDVFDVFALTQNKSNCSFVFILSWLGAMVLFRKVILTKVIKWLHPKGLILTAIDKDTVSTLDDYVLFFHG